jgi:hypothetical protein
VSDAVRALGLALAAATAACTSLAPPACAPGEERSVQELIYFGTGRPGGGVVTSDDWARFLSTVVTPRFPQGLTVWPASGQWQGADGTVTREGSYVLNLVHRGDSGSEASIRAIAGDYASRFGQEAVLRVRSAACASFQR